MRTHVIGATSNRGNRAVIRLGGSPGASDYRGAGGHAPVKTQPQRNRIILISSVHIKRGRAVLLLLSSSSAASVFSSGRSMTINKRDEPIGYHYIVVNTNTDLVNINIYVYVSTSWYDKTSITTTRCTTANPV